ncbi:MAG: metallophosphoesterase [Blastocatellia bacterium]|nr:metallophosphoesterase [Blastocatellia bacterium]MBL8192949.1 metallophosphoesterase [Blastocatellia bacterium]MBN8721638.1 metallophosphoesterase [Acidobacteriota bacterium]
MIPLKWEKRLQEYLKERENWLKELYQTGSTWEGRRKFLKMSAMAAGFAATQSFVPHSFQLVDVVNAATPDSKQQAFTFAYISDSHLYEKTLNERFVRQLERAVADINALDPQPDFVLYGGDLAQLGQPGELKLGAQILKQVKAPLKMMVGEHDWFLDMGDLWKELFGKHYYSFDHKGVHFITLMSVNEKDFWTAKNLSPMQRMQIVSGLDDGRQSAFEVGVEEREWLARDLANIPKTTPIVVFSHSPLYKLYRPWNFWTDDADEIQALLQPFQTVTVVHGHTHQVLTNRIGNIHFHGMLSTAWPWPYAPQGLPKLTMQMNRPDPFNQTEGLGDGIIDVLGNGRVNKRYDLWNRNPMSVTAKYLDSNGQEDLPAKTSLPSY